MMITLEVNSELEAELLWKARTEGLSLEAYARNCLAALVDATGQAADTGPKARQTAAGEGDQALPSVNNLQHMPLFAGNWRLAAALMAQAAAVAAPPPPACIQCGSVRVIVGEVGSFSYLHARVQQSFFTFERPDSPNVFLDAPGYICLACGLVWSHVDPRQVYEKLDIWAPPEWKARLRKWRDQQGDDLLRAAREGSPTDSEELLRAAPMEGTDRKD